MKELKYCCYGIHGGCYFEFQKGNYFIGEKHWLESSLFVDEDIVNEVDLGGLFYQVMPHFNYFGPTKVTPEQWTEVKHISEKMSPTVQTIISEIDEWVQICFQSENCFSICGV